MNKVMEYLCSCYKGNETVEHRNCKIIEKKLLEHGIPVKYVSRHELFGINYFNLVIEADDDDYVFEENICEVFDIPKEWVGFTSVDPRVLCIKEEEMIERFGDCKGRLYFEEWNIKDKSIEEVRDRLYEKGITARVSIDGCSEFKYFIIQLVDNSQDELTWLEIQDALNVSDVGVVKSGNYYIVERIKE